MDKTVAENFGLKALDAGQKRAGFTIYEAHAVDSNVPWTVWCANKKTQGKLSKWVEAVSTLRDGESPYLKCLSTPSGLWVATTREYGVSLLEYESGEGRRLAEVLYLAYRFLDAMDHLASSGIALDSSMFEDVRISRGNAGLPELGFPGLSPETREDAGTVDKARLAGRFVYMLLTGDLPPTEQTECNEELDGERVGAFDSLLLDWVEEHTMATGLGGLAMQAYESELDVTAFSKALYPHFQREVANLVSVAARAASLQQQLNTDAETSRSRLVELESNITEQEQWLKGHSDEIERAEARVFAAQGRLRQLEILEQDISAQLGLESTTNFDLEQGEMVAEPMRSETVVESEPPLLPSAHNDEEIELDPNQFWPDDPRQRRIAAVPKLSLKAQPVAVEELEMTSSKGPRLLPVFASGLVLGGVVVALFIWFTINSSQPGAPVVVFAKDIGVELSQGDPSIVPIVPATPSIDVPAKAVVDSKVSSADASIGTVSGDKGNGETRLDAVGGDAKAEPALPGSETTVKPIASPSAPTIEIPEDMVRMSGGQLRRGLDKSQANRLMEMCFRVFGVSARRCRRIAKEVAVEPKLDVVKPFAIDKTEVEFSDYQRCVQASICPAPAHEWNKKNYPVTGVSPKAADVYCRWRDRRLPMELEWVFTVRSTQDSRVYPWGDRPPKRGQANLGTWANEPSTDARDGYRYVAPVTSFKSGSNQAGVINLVGNVQEFVVLDRQTEFVAKGGGYLSLGFEARVTAQRDVSPDQTATDLGFRCALSL